MTELRSNLISFSSIARFASLELNQPSSPPPPPPLPTLQGKNNTTNDKLSLTLFHSVCKSKFSGSRPIDVIFNSWPLFWKHSTSLKPCKFPSSKIFSSWKRPEYLFRLLSFLPLPARFLFLDLFLINRAFSVGHNIFRICSFYASP